MLTIEADIYEYVRMSYVDKNILGPLVHMHVCVCAIADLVELQVSAILEGKLSLALWVKGFGICCVVSIVTC